MIKFNKVWLIYFFAVIAISGCHQMQKFDREKWNSGDGLDYPMRDDIVDDLVQNHKLKGLKYWGVIHLLKYPQSRDSVSFSYQIISTYTNTFKHNHIKNLVLYMGKDSIISRVAIYDNKAKIKSLFY
jgi:hypothetical protein